MRKPLNESMKAVMRPAITPVWRRIWSRIEFRLAPVERRLAAIEALHSHASEQSAETEKRLAETEKRLAETDTGWNTHLPAFLNAVSSVGAFGFRLLEQSRKLEQLSTRIEAVERLPQLESNSIEIARLWDRVEFVRREIMYEMAHGANSTRQETQTETASKPQIIAHEKVMDAIANGRIRLNLGCGHIALPEYINVDRRKLPGVDIVAEAGNLPFEAGTVAEIFSAHLVEHFPQEALRRRLLPYWATLLKSGGHLRAITPDAAAMIKAASTSEYSFDDFREALFGAQDYEGDYHYNLLRPQSMTELLREAGFIDVVVPVEGRRNGKCYEFEISGQKP